MGTLFKTPMHGGIVTITEREIVVGEGWLGTRNVRRFPLQSLAHLDLLPSPHGNGLQHSVLVRFVWTDGQITEVDGVGPIAAQRLSALLQEQERLVKLGNIQHKGRAMARLGWTRKKDADSHRTG